MNQDSLIFEEPKGPNKELRVLGTACYIPFGFILPYILEKSHIPFVLFHLKQGLGYFGAFVLISLFPWLKGSFGFALIIYILLGAWTWYFAYKGEEYSPIIVTGIKKIFSYFSK